MSIKSPFFQTNQFSCFRYYINLSLFTTIITIGTIITTIITTIGPDLVKFSSFASESLCSAAPMLEAQLPNYNCR